MENLFLQFTSTKAGSVLGHIKVLQNVPRTLCSLRYANTGVSDAYKLVIRGFAQMNMRLIRLIFGS